jgi:hypothetical protein
VTHDEFNYRLRELIAEITTLPIDKQKQLIPLIEETKKRQNTIKENVDKINQSLDGLRICLKYMLFDLEATRRERDALKKILNDEEKDNPPFTADEDL